VGPTRGTYDHPLQVAFARGAWPSPHLLPHGGGVRPMATLLPALGSSIGPPPFSVCRRRRSSTAHPSSPSIAVGVLPHLAPRPCGCRREREGPTDGHGSGAFASTRHHVPLLHIPSQEPKMQVDVVARWRDLLHSRKRAGVQV
jgi:hypothetical protein